MRFVIFTHSLVSDWNHGNAHFLRGIASELISRGHQVDIYEPVDGWSRQNLLREQGTGPLRDFSLKYPLLKSTLYEENTLDLDEALRDSDVTIVHEWNTPSLVATIGRHRRRHDYQLLFHDTHHRVLTDRAGISNYDLSEYDGVLAYGRVIRDAYLSNGWARRAWTWHEAADVRVFHPLANVQKDGDLVWVGNWGDNERADSLREFLIIPVKSLGLKTRVYGVRYPTEALAELDDAGIEYCGWLPNYAVPDVFSRHRITVHVPRRPYVQALPGIPTIRPFEAMACGIPLISAPWHDAETLFNPGRDFLFAQNGEEMTRTLERIVSEPQLASTLAAHGLRTISDRHTCAHRVDELFGFLETPANAGEDKCKLHFSVQA
ncbi:MAG TPA: glycosyltransferase [Bryobacteraceae bacterium]|jgi:spore maturation protein CgeB|nr:glycosyltransferase [Bryobacteraceae bacterium]